MRLCTCRHRCCRCHLSPEVVVSGGDETLVLCKCTPSVLSSSVIIEIRECGKANEQVKDRV